MIAATDTSLTQVFKNMSFQLVIYLKEPEDLNTLLGLCSSLIRVLMGPNLFPGISGHRSSFRNGHPPPEQGRDEMLGRRLDLHPDCGDSLARLVLDRSRARLGRVVPEQER